MRALLTLRMQVDLLPALPLAILSHGLLCSLGFGARGGEVAEKEALCKQVVGASQLQPSGEGTLDKGEESEETLC